VYRKGTEEKTYISIQIVVIIKFGRAEWSIVLGIGIIVVIITPCSSALDKCQCFSSKALSRLRRSSTGIEVWQCAPKPVQTLPVWEALLKFFWVET
jgi:hypothetical protein